MKRNKIILSIAMIFMFLPIFADAAIISDNRLIQWQPGIPGGIPSRTTICANVKESPYNAIGDGVADDTAAIQNALNNCPQNSVVYLPEGTYKISAQLSLVNKGIVIRGDGPSKTKILQTSATGIISFSASSSGAITDVLSGFIKGSNQLTVADASSFNVGDYVYIDQLNDPALVDSYGCSYCSFWSSDQGNRTLGEGALITAKSGNILTLDRGLYYTFSSQFVPKLKKVSATPMKNAGVEDLYLEMLVPGGKANILMQACVKCWVKNVESNKGGEDHIRMRTCYKSEIRDSYIHHGYYFSGGKSYGVTLFNHNTDILVENNVFYYLRHSMVIEAGGAGNVFAYCYSDRMFEENYPNTDWLMADLAIHGSHPYMNLFEGNMGNHIGPDYTHGSSSQNTFFRNYIDMESLGESRNITLHLIGADIQKYNRYINLVGNVFGELGYTGVYEAENVVCSNGQKYIYKIGYEYDSDCQPTGNDPLVKQTLLRHGNFDYISNSVVWDPTISDHNIPNSLYLSSKPSWFGSLPWPAIGPDISPMSGTIPAKQRFDAIMAGTSGGTDTEPPADTTPPSAPTGVSVN